MTHHEHPPIDNRLLEQVLERFTQIMEYFEMTIDELNAKVAKIAAGIDALEANADQIATLTAAATAAAGSVAPQALEPVGAALDAVIAKLPA
jgi:methyl-accepting chemotaxis protein